MIEFDSREGSEEGGQTPEKVAKKKPELITRQTLTLIDGCSNNKLRDE